MSQRRWDIPAVFVPGAAWPDVPPLIQRLLQQRGVTSPAAAASFLHPRYPEDLANPREYVGMDQVVARLTRAIVEGEPMTIYGDYDADGICATATMVELLQALGGRVDWYVPERLAEGYGLHAQAIADLAERGTKVLISVDCGTSNVAEIRLANERGLEVIVLDHHQAPPALPPALAIINPFLPGQTYPFTGHSSGGVTFTVAQALLAATQNGALVKHPVPRGWEKWLLDLTAISTVADMMPLRADNRTLVHFGLQVLRKTRRPGLRALFSQIGSDMSKATETTIGYQIAPRLNAAGRLQHAGTALKLLLTTDVDEARVLAEQLHQVNGERQRLTEMAVLEAMEQVTAQGEQSGYVAFAPHWSPGIVGLIAGRIVERVWRPVVVMTENGDRIVGSGRSVPGFNITEHLRTGPEHFARFGGHAGACGFTLVSREQRELFISWWQTSVPMPPSDTRTKPVVLDVEAALEDFTPPTLDALEQLAPFGIEHPRPLFYLPGLRVVQAQTIGSDGQHLRLKVRQGTTEARCIGFRFGAAAAELPSGAIIDLAVEVSWNDWQGRREPQLKIVDWRMHHGD